MKNKQAFAPLIMAEVMIFIVAIRAISGGDDFDKIFGCLAIFAGMIFIVAYYLGLKKQEKE